MGMNKLVMYSVNGDGECEVKVVENLMEKDVDISNVWYERVDSVRDIKFSELEELINEIDGVDEEEREKWEEFIDVVNDFDESGEYLFVVKEWSYDGSGWYVGVMCVSML